MKYYTLGKTLDILAGYLCDALMKENIKKPMAYALYHTWKDVDLDERERPEIKEEGDG